jgi:hypothetical protein
LLIAKLLVRASKKNLETAVPPPLVHEISLVLSLHPPASRRFPLGTCPGDFTPAAPPDWSALSRMATAPGTSAPRTNANCSMNGSSKKGAPPSVPPTVFGRGDPARAVALFNRVARAGAKKAAPDLYTYGTIIRCSDAGQLNLVSLPSGRSSRRDGGCKPSPSINCSRASVQGRMWT